MGQEVLKPCILRVGILVEGQSQALFEKIVELCTNAQAMPEQVAEEQIQIRCIGKRTTQIAVQLVKFRIWREAERVPILPLKLQGQQESLTMILKHIKRSHDPQAHKKDTSTSCLLELPRVSHLEPSLSSVWLFNLFLCSFLILHRYLEHG